MGIVDEGSVVGDMVGPTEHIFLAEKAGWWQVGEGDGLEKHEGFNEQFQRRLEKWEVNGKERRGDV